MIKNYWYIGQKGTFKETRNARIGASEVGQLFPNPEKPTESISGYNETALTLYEKKTGKPQPFKSNYSTRIGHALENDALEFFIERFFNLELAITLRVRKEQYENECKIADIKGTDKPNPEDYQVGLFRHNVEYYHEGMIVHPDLIYLGEKGAKKITVEGITVDLSKPFYLEAKSARKEATKRHNDSYVKGYDFDSTTWQGIPLKHYVQMQYQSALMEIDVGYLPLLHNTSEFQVWRVDKDKKWQSRIIDTVGKMLKYIEMKKKPREMAICLSDIIALYPTLRNDFITVSGDQSEKIKEACRIYKKANQQIKNWEGQKKDAQDSLGVWLRDYDEIRDGSDILAKWKKISGRESIGISKDVSGKLSFLKWLKINDMNTLRYLERKGYLKTGKDSRSVAVKFKGE